MLWDNYVFRRGPAVRSLWDAMYSGREIRLLYITGIGFDPRATTVLREYSRALQASGANVDDGCLLKISLSGYELDTDLIQVTQENEELLDDLFKPLGRVESIAVRATASREVELTATQALRVSIDQVLDQISDQTDIILDVSSLPRVVYLAIMTGILHRLIGDARNPESLGGTSTTLQVLVAEDSELDATIFAEDLSEIVTVPGFSRALIEESTASWPLVWFPILGEGRVGQLQKILSAAIPNTAEICPVLPSPSRNPRRADLLLQEYRDALFPKGISSISDFLLVHEANPFEAYRQLYRAMIRYKESLELLGGCKLYVTPLGSKLVTVGAGLACFDVRTSNALAKHRVSIPHAEPTRYRADTEKLSSTRPQICSLTLTGEAYRIHETSS